MHRELLLESTFPMNFVYQVVWYVLFSLHWRQKFGFLKNTRICLFWNKSKQSLSQWMQTFHTNLVKISCFAYHALVSWLPMQSYLYSTCDWSMICEKRNFDWICMEGLQVYACYWSKIQIFGINIVWKIVLPLGK